MVESIELEFCVSSHIFVDLVSDVEWRGHSCFGLALAFNVESGDAFECRAFLDQTAH